MDLHNLSYMDRSGHRYHGEKGGYHIHISYIYIYTYDIYIYIYMIYIYIWYIYIYKSMFFPAHRPFG